MRKYRRVTVSDNKLARFFDWISATIEGAENSFATFMASISPWLAPISPAYLSYEHLKNTLGFPAGVAFTVAAVVEGLGFSTIYTVMQFIMANRFLRKNEKRRKAPTWIVTLVFAFYIALVVMLNVSLEWIAAPEVQWMRLFVIFLLSVLSVPAGVLVASRVAYRELLDEYEHQKLESKSENSGKFQKIPTNGHEREPIPEENSKKVRYDWRFVSEDEKRSLVGLHWKDIMALYPGMEERTARNWWRRVKDEYEQAKNT